MSDPKHNISRDDAFVLFNLSRVEEFQHKKNSSNGEYVSRLEMAEANGLDKWAIKEALKIKKSGEVTLTVQRLQALMRYLRLLGIPLQAAQLEMFETAPQSQPGEEKAYEQGFGTAMLGESHHDNPHDVSTDFGQAWLRGWNEGCKVRSEFQNEEASQAEQSEQTEADQDQADIEDTA